MIVTDINLKRLDPSTGMRLTNGTDIAEGSVFLGVNDSAENWYEITDAEYAEAMEKLEQLTEEE